MDLPDRDKHIESHRYLPCKGDASGLKAGYPDRAAEATILSPVNFLTLKDIFPFDFPTAFC
jgi:hypothetical protein